MFRYLRWHSSAEIPGVDTPREFYFIILFYCILLSAFVGSYECRKMHGMSNIINKIMSVLLKTLVQR